MEGRDGITKEQTKAGHVTQLGECLYSMLDALSSRVTSSRSAPAMQDCPKKNNNKLPKIGVFLAQTEGSDDPFRSLVIDWYISVIQKHF